MAVLTSGNPAVDMMGSIRITGNITDLEWYNHIRKPSGKPNHLAVSILSDIVYWYRPTDIRDENTGFVIAKKTKFKGDLLQKTYKAYADMYGESRQKIIELRGHKYVGDYKILTPEIIVDDIEALAPSDRDEMVRRLIKMLSLLL